MNLLRQSRSTLNRAAQMVVATTTFAVAASTTATQANAQSLGIAVSRVQSVLGTVGEYGFGAGGQHRSSTSFGIAWRQKLLKRISFTPELLYVQKGNEAPASPSFSLSYLEAPLLFRFGGIGSRNEHIRPHFTLGPTVAVRTDCKFSGLFANGELTDQPCAKITTPLVADYRYDRMDVGMLGGVGFETQFANGTVMSFDLRMERSVKGNRSSGTDLQYRNQAYYLGAQIFPKFR